MRVSISQQEISRRLEEINKFGLKKSFDLSPAHIIITDENANVLYANKAVENSTGFSQIETIGKNPAVDMQPKIFTKVESTTGGAGLGLFIVKMTCDYFGWKVWFDTGESSTTFYVKIPFPNQ